MSKKKHTKPESASATNENPVAVEATDSSEAEAEAESVTHDRRLDTPIIRLKGRLQDAAEQAKRDLERLERWGSENNSPDLMLLKDEIRSVLTSLASGADACDRLHSTGFEIKRAPAAFKEGDTVAILGRCQQLYCDVLPIDHMAYLKVVKIYPGRGGALVVESSTGARQRVAFAHVERV
jgi:hypothetical protein